MDIPTWNPFTYHGTQGIQRPPGNTHPGRLQQGNDPTPYFNPNPVLPPWGTRPPTITHPWEGQSRNPSRNEFGPYNRRRNEFIPSNRPTHGNLNNGPRTVRTRSTGTDTRGPLSKFLTQYTIIKHHALNWTNLPKNLDQQVEDLMGSINPPLPNPQFLDQKRNTTNEIKNLIVTLITNHLNDRMDELVSNLPRQTNTNDQIDTETAIETSRRDLYNRFHRKIRGHLTNTITEAKEIWDSNNRQLTRPEHFPALPQSNNRDESDLMGPRSPPKPQRSPRQRKTVRTSTMIPAKDTGLGSMTNELDQTNQDLTTTEQCYNPVTRPPTGVDSVTRPPTDDNLITRPPTNEYQTTLSSSTLPLVDMDSGADTIAPTISHPSTSETSTTTPQNTEHLRITTTETVNELPDATPSTNLLGIHQQTNVPPSLQTPTPGPVGGTRLPNVTFLQTSKLSLNKSKNQTKADDSSTVQDQPGRHKAQCFFTPSREMTGPTNPGASLHPSNTCEPVPSRTTMFTQMDSDNIVIIKKQRQGKQALNTFHTRTPQRTDQEELEPSPPPPTSRILSSLKVPRLNFSGSSTPGMSTPGMSSPGTRMTHFERRYMTDLHLEVLPNIKTLIVGDSNTRHISNIPDDVQIETIPGLNLQKTAELLSDMTQLYPGQNPKILKNLVIHVGINNRTTKTETNRRALEAITQQGNKIADHLIFQGICYNTRHLPNNEQQTIEEINQLARQINNKMWFIPNIKDIPVTDDHIHHTNRGAQTIFYHIIRSLQALN